MSRPCVSGLVTAWGSWGSAGALVGLGRVDGEGSEELAGDCVDDADVEVFDEQDHGGSGVGSSDADLDHLAVVAEGDFAGLVDLVAADSLVMVAAAVAGSGFGACLIGDGGSRALRQRRVASCLVVVGAELVEACLEIRQRFWSR